MACQRYWNNVVLKLLFRLTLQLITLDYFELPLHYCHMKMVVSYLSYQNLAEYIAKIRNGVIHRFV